MVHRRGFTLIELLVVIAIIAVLIGLLLPAVQKVRESATQTRCLNNMKQLGVAFHAYVNEWGRFCPGYTSRHNFAPYILPYIEEFNVIKHYDFNKTWSDNTPNGSFGISNYTITDQNIPLLKCPGAPDQRPRNWVSDYCVSNTISSTAYTHTQMPASPSPNQYSSFWMRGGTAATEPGPRPQEIGDGLSVTWMLLEDVGRPQYWRYGQKYSGSSSNAEWSDPAAVIVIQVSTSTSTTAPGCIAGGKSIINCNNNNEIYSFHQGNSGAMFLFGDGSAKFIRDNLAGNVFRALYTANGNESVDQKAY